MIIGKLTGWLFLCLAFAFAAAETAAQGLVKQHGLISAYTVLHTLMPGELIQTRIFIERNIHPALWDPFIRAILWLPGWLSLGLPGIFLSWTFRDRPEGGDLEDDGVHISSSYDDILAAAEEADEYNFSPPSKYEHLAEFDPSMSGDDLEGPEDQVAEFQLEPKHLAENNLADPDKKKT